MHLLKKLINILLIFIDIFLKNLSLIFLRKIKYQNKNNVTKDFYIPFQNRIKIKNSNNIYQEYLSNNRFKRELEFNDEALKIFLDLKKKNLTYIDLGSSFGYFAISVLEELNYVNDVILIEPNKFVFKILKKNMTSYSSTTKFSFINSLIGDNNVCQFNEKFSFSNTGKSSVQNPLANSNVWGYQKKIKSRTLDDALSNAIFKNNDILLKIDVEGNELKVIENSPLIFKRISYLIIETSQTKYKKILEYYGFNKFIYLNNIHDNVLDLLVVKN